MSPGHVSSSEIKCHTQEGSVLSIGCIEGLGFFKRGFQRIFSFSLLEILSVLSVFNPLSCHFCTFHVQNVAFSKIKI